MSRIGALLARVSRAVGRFFVERPWLAVAACAVAGGVLGFAGIRGYYGRMGRDGWPGGIEPTNLDVLYRTLQLFIWQSGGEFVGTRVGADLQIARLLAPTATAWAAFLALAGIFVNEWQGVRARLSARHVIVCGLGRRGLLYAERLRAAGWTVVMIERDPRNPWLALARRSGAVLVGDATDGRVLARAGVSRAIHLIAVCRDDAVNVSIAARAEQLRARSSRRPVLTCHVHILDDAVWHAIRERELAPAPGRVRLHFVNPLDWAARILVADHLRLAGDGSRAPRLLLVGVSPLTEYVVLHAARAWSVESAEPLAITLAAPEATAVAARLRRRHPGLERRANLIPRDAEIDSIGFLHDTRQQDEGVPGTVTAVVCLTREESAVPAGLHLFHRLRRASGRVIVCVAEDSGLFALLHGSGSGALAEQDFVLFRVIDQICRPALLLNSTNELLARAIHEAYRRHQRQQGQTPATNPSLADWDELDDRLKESNRRQADDIGRKLEAISCGIAPSNGPGVPAFEFTDPEVLQLARLEHARWRREREEAGWRYAPGVKRDSTHPYLVEWESLPEEVREIDIRAVREIPALAARAGFQIYRRSTASRAAPSASPPLPERPTAT